MAIGSGLGSSFGYKAESTYGTAVTVDQFTDFNDESLKLQQTWTDPQGLAAGRLTPLVTRMAQTTRAAAGSVSMDFATKSMHRLIKQMIGSPLTIPTIVGAGPAYAAAHTLGNAGGMSMTWQFGIPQPDGTAKPFTYTGVKVTGWEISSQVGELVKLSLDADAQDEKVTTPALATPSYVTGAEVFNHTQLVVKLGGTASTASSVVSIASGVTASTLINGVSVKGSNPMATDRFGTGATKNEPIQNGMFDCSIDLDGEFTSQAEIYDVWRAGTVVPVQLTWTGSTLGATNYKLDIIASAAKFETVEVDVAGPDVVGLKATLKVRADGTNNPLQITFTSSDTVF